MEKDIKQLDHDLKVDFSRLDIKGENIESFYSYRFELFLFENSEIPPKERIEAILTGQIYKYTNEYTENEKYEITIQKTLTEPTFIQDQLVKHEANLKKPINPDNREKLNIWVDFLEQKKKAISEIKLPVPPWSQPLIALYMKYKGIDYNDNNVKTVCETLGFKGKITELKDKYYEFRKVENRTFPNIDLKSEKPKADAMLIRLNELKLIMEDRNEKETAAFESLLSDIKELNKNLGYL